MMKVPGIPYVQGVNDYDDRDNVKYGIAIHNTSNTATDTGEASYATWRPDGTSSHFYVDADSVTQSLDTGDKAGHAGSGTGNENAIAVEITGTNGKSRGWWLGNVAWDKLASVLATVIRHHWPDGSFQVRRASVAEMKANPKVRAFYAHDDMRRAWGGTTHDDPGPNFPWDRLLAAVSAALEGPDMEQSEKLTRPTSNPNRTVGDLYYDLSNLRDYLVDVPGGTEPVSPPPAGSRIDLLLQAARKVLAPQPEQPAPIVTDEQLERVLRKVIGGVDGASPAGSV